MICPSDAWVFSKIMCGHVLNGELDTLQPPWKDVGVHLDGLVLADRSATLQTVLLGQVDRAEVVAAIAAQNPNGPAPPAASTPSTRPRYVMRCAADIRPRKMEWIWENRVPRGMMSMFAGDPKLGKSFVAQTFAACVSRGAPMPQDSQTYQPASAIILNAEDDASRVTIPRLTAAGANLRNIHVFESVILQGGNEALPSLATDLDKIREAAISLPNTRLITIDPVSAFLGGADDYRNSELRGILAPLKKLAEDLDIAVLMVTHLNKSASANGKYRVLGSVAYLGASRANFLFVRDRDGPTGRRVLMLDNGCNNEEPAPTLAYQIRKTDDGPVVEWNDDPVDVTAEAALRAEIAAVAGRPKDGGKEDQTERSEVKHWLSEWLAKDGPVLAKDIQEAVKVVGYAWRTVERAKKDLGIVSDREGFGKDSKIFWKLPDMPEILAFPT